MKNLYRWLKNHNITYKTNTCTNNYFYNAAAVSIETAEIEISTTELKELALQAKALEKYLSKYNYHIYIDARLQRDIYGVYHKYYHVTSDTNAATLEKYSFFSDAAAAECELLIHEYHIKGIHESQSQQLNNELRAIMNKYGTLYNQSLLHIVAA